MRPWWLVVALAGCGDHGEPAPPTVTCDGPDVRGLPAISVVADATHVYWNDGHGVVVRAPLGGGEPEGIAKIDGNTRGMAIDATSVYVAGGCQGQLWKVDKSTGAAISLVKIALEGSDSCIHGVTVDDEFAYFTTNTVSRVPLGGGFFQALPAVPPGGGCSSAIVLVGDALAWTECSNEIHTMARIGGPVQIVLQDASFEALATDGESVYFVSGGEIRKQTGATQSTIGPAAGAVALAVDSTSVYWAAAANEVQLGGVHRTTIATGAVTELATTDRDHVGIAVDSSRVYFGGGTGCPVESVAK